MKDLEELLAAVKAAYPTSDYSAKLCTNEKKWRLVLVSRAPEYYNIAGEGETISAAFKRLCERVSEDIEAAMAKKATEFGNLIQSIKCLSEKRDNAGTDIFIKADAIGRIAKIGNNNTGDL